MKFHAAAIQNKVGRALRSSTPSPESAIDFVVFFADGPGQSYQLEQWIKPFEVLHDRGYGVCIVLMNALSARMLAQRTRLPLLLSRSMENIENALSSWGTSAVFYVNNSQANFTMLRLNGPAHVHVGHGESEKASMVSNQLKSYDSVFICGAAARARIVENIPRFDPSKLVEIGRPQLDVPAQDAVAPRTGARIKVLYAPTWEGDARNMAYGSITEVGARLVETMLTDNRFTVVFRPHPKTGTWSATSRKEMARISNAVDKAAALIPEAGHRIETSGNSSLSISTADIVLCDISAMAMDTIGLDRPLMLLRSTHSPLSHNLASEQSLSLESAATALATDNGRAFLDTIADMGTRSPSKEQRTLRREVFGDPLLGKATDRFITAVVSVSGLIGRP